MRYLSIPVSDQSYEDFMEIQKRKGFRNQSDTLEFLIQKCKAEVEVKK